MNNNIITFTDKRFNAANIEGIANRETRALYSEFTQQKQLYLDAKNRYENAQTVLGQGGQSVRLDIIQAHRAMNAAETRLTHLSQAIGKAILKIRRESGCFRRIDYRIASTNQRA